MNQASFRVDLDSPVTTHIGVGVARDDASGRLFVTITYAEFPPRIDAPRVVRCIEDAVEVIEGSRVDMRLSQVAQRYAEGLASGGERALLWPDINNELEDVARGRYWKIGIAVVTTINVTAIAPRDLVHGQPVDPRQRLDGDPEAAARRACLAAASGRSSSGSSAGESLPRTPDP